MSNDGFGPFKQNTEDLAHALVKAYYEEILRYCFYKLHSQQAAQDATQDTFLKAIRHIGGIAGERNYRAYLYKIAANTCIDVLRKKVPEPLMDQHSYIERGFQQVEAQDALLRRVACLPALQQEAVILRYAHELTVKEIAQVLDVPMRTVQSRLRLALKKLRAVDGKIEG